MPDPEFGQIPPPESEIRVGCPDGRRAVGRDPNPGGRIPQDKVRWVEKGSGQIPSEEARETCRVAGGIGEALVPPKGEDTKTGTSPKERVGLAPRKRREGRARADQDKRVRKGPRRPKGGTRLRETGARGVVETEPVEETELKETTEVASGHGRGGRERKPK